VLFVGECYCLLRREFFEARDKSIKKRKAFQTTNKLLVNFGSTDPTGHTLQALRGLNYFAASRHVEVHVLVGSACPYLKEIETLALCASYKVILHIDSERVAELITDVDLAIGAAGVSTWERCFLGLPTLLVKTAENQTDVVNRVISSGAAVGYFQPLEDEYSLASALTELERQHDQVADLALQMKISEDLGAITSLVLGE
jgi:UDP-2,4-diacetamido-2,4,6-trideoxy-beta-L-altropyranose hydrolase